MRTVLIIDDQPAVLDALSLLLSLHDIRSLIAHTPEQGLATLARERVDVVIQDMNFTADTTSGAEGADLFRAIRARHTDLPVILLTLYWKKCNTAGVVAGLVVGTLSAIGLVLVSPNMTYPKAVTAAAQKVVAAAPARIEKLEADLAAAADPAAKEKVAKALAGAKKDLATNQATLKKLEGQTTSLVGLEKPLFELRNPGIISIPLGFLAVIVFSLLTTDKRSLATWDELYVRSNTGLGRAGVSH